MGGFQRMAVTAAMNTTRRTSARNGAVAAHCAGVAIDGRYPDQRGEAAAVDAAEFGQLGDQRVGGDPADAGNGGEQVLGSSPDRRATHLVVDLAVDDGERGFERLEGAGDALEHLGAARGALPVAFHTDHLDHLAPAGYHLRKALRRLARQRPRLGADRLSEVGDQLGVEPVGLGEPPGGAREGSHLGRIDHRQRQPGPGDPGRHGDLETARGLEHDEHRIDRSEPVHQRRDAGAVPAHDESFSRRAKMHVEAILGNVDDDEHGLSPRCRVRRPRL